TSGGSSSPEALLWVERERKIRNIILTPSMIMVWILGLALAANVGLFSGQHGLGWLHLKLALVLILSGYHGWAVGYARKLAAGKPTLTGRQLRLIN
ncbi:CopD family protein, partial [Klebsiella quasipneumoniae]